MLCILGQTITIMFTNAYNHWLCNLHMTKSVQAYTTCALCKL